MYASLATFPTAFGSAVFAFEGRDFQELFFLIRAGIVKMLSKKERGQRYLGNS